MFLSHCKTILRASEADVVGSILCTGRSSTWFLSESAYLAVEMIVASEHEGFVLLVAS